MERLKVTPEALVDLPVPHDVRISPCGSKAVYKLRSTAKAGEHEVASIWIAEIGRESSTRQLTSGLFNDESPQWCANSQESDHRSDYRNCIAFISDRAKAGESSAIYLIDPQGGEPYPITKADNKEKMSTFKWDWSGRLIAYTSADEKSSEQKSRDEESGDVKVYGDDLKFNRLRCVHIATREVRTLFNKDAHVTDFAWNQDGSTITLVSQQTPDMNSAGYHGVTFETVNVSSRETVCRCDFPGPVKDLTWPSVHENIYFRAGATPDAMATSSSVYGLSLEHKTWSMVEFPEICCVMELRQYGSMLVAHVQEGLRDALYNWVPGEHDSLSQAYHNLGDIHTWDVIRAPSTQKLVKAVAKSDASNPSEVYSQEDEESALCQLSQHGSVVARSQIGLAKPIYGKNGDTKCDGIFVQPSSSKDTTSLPTIVYIHGGPYGRVSVAFDSSYFYWVPYLVSAGYAVLYPNYRGGSSHGEDFAKQARGAMGTKDYEDVITLLQEGISQNLIDKERVIVAGYSQGGFLSYLALTRPDFRFKAGICGAGVTDWDMMSMTSDATWFEGMLAGKTPWETDESDTRARHGSAIWHMDNMKKTPVLILHGEKDERVPLTQAVAFHRGCLHHGVPCEFVTYPREGHVIKERKHIIDMMKRVRRFCDLHLR